MGDVDHFLGDDAGAGIFILRDHLAGLAAIDRQFRRAAGHQLAVADIAVVFRLHRAWGDPIEATPSDPLRADRRQTGFQVDGRGRVRVDAGAVIGAIRLFLRRWVQRDLAERDHDVGMALGAAVDLVRPGDRAGGHRARTGSGFRLDRHGPLLASYGGHVWRGEGVARKIKQLAIPSLRRHDPVQVQGSRCRRRSTPTMPSLSP